MTRLAGSHVIVTGDSQGIGLATAQACTQGGARVSIIGRDPERLAQAQRRLPQGTATVSADVTAQAALEADIVELVDAQGPCDIPVAAAGRAEPGYFLDLATDVFVRQMELNYLGVLHAVRAVLPAMVDRGHGHLVLISSLSGLMGVFGYGAYTPTKFAIRGLGEALARSADHHGPLLRAALRRRLRRS